MIRQAKNDHDRSLVFCQRYQQLINMTLASGATAVLQHYWLAFVTYRYERAKSVGRSADCQSPWIMRSAVILFPPTN